MALNKSQSLSTLNDQHNLQVDSMFICKMQVSSPDCRIQIENWVVVEKNRLFLGALNMVQSNNECVSAIYLTLVALDCWHTSESEKLETKWPTNWPKLTMDRFQPLSWSNECHLAHTLLNVKIDRVFKMMLFSWAFSNFLCLKRSLDCWKMLPLLPLSFIV